MLRESETVIWLMVFEDLVLIIFLALISAGNQNLIIFLVKIIGVLGVLYALAHYGKEFLISILDRDDELPILFTFAAVLTTASFSMYLGVPESMMVIALGSPSQPRIRMRSSSTPARSKMFFWSCFSFFLVSLLTFPAA